MVPTKEHTPYCKLQGIEKRSNVANPPGFLDTNITWGLNRFLPQGGKNCKLENPSVARSLSIFHIDKFHMRQTMPHNSKIRLATNEAGIRALAANQPFSLAMIDWKTTQLDGKEIGERVHLWVEASGTQSVDKWFRHWTFYFKCSHTKISQI